MPWTQLREEATEEVKEAFITRLEITRDNGHLQAIVGGAAMGKSAFSYARRRNGEDGGVHITAKREESHI